MKKATSRSNRKQKVAPRARKSQSISITPRPRRMKTKEPKPWLADALAGAGGTVGTYLGGPLGGLLGSAGGRLIGTGIKAITGFGDYKIEKNVFMDGNPEVYNKNSHGGTVIRKREYLGDIITSATASAFSIQSFFINPGQEQSFPWLSQVAENYEEFVFEGLLFEFRSMSSDALNSTNTALGSVIMATNYNAATAAFATKSEMENYIFGQSCKSSCDMIHPIECKSSQNVLGELYVRPGAVPSGQDQKTYDLGNFQIATVGFQGTSVNIGELWVTYQVALLKPKLWTALGQGNVYAHYNATAGLANATPLGTAVSVQDTIGVTVSTTAITFPQSQLKQTYVITWLYAGSSATLVYPTIVNTSGLSNVQLFKTNVGTGSTVQVPSGGTSSPGASLQICVSTNQLGSTPVLTFGTGGTLPTAPSYMDLHIYQIPNTAL